ncbi:MAG: D-aminoacyl-tRNA deacylase [Acidobacteria bacterium]|nr:D-aminoacyl-tRNA deacylase [Acidobacteriota bacterium]
MIAVAQRVASARVTVADEVTGEIGPGMLILLGVARGDEPSDASYLARKMAALRIFPDENGRMNRSIGEVGGAILAVSQFTLLADCAKGNRPSFDQAAPAEDARRLYEYFVEQVRAAGIPVQTGRFQAEMKVELVNQGPITLIVESPNHKKDRKDI